LCLPQGPPICAVGEIVCEGRETAHQQVICMYRGPAVAAPCGRWHADHVDLTEKLQIKPGQSLALLNPPPGVTLPTSTAGGQPATAAVVVGFAVHRDDLGRLGPVISAARADRLAWIGYPKGGKLGTDLNRDRLAQALACEGIQPARQVSIDDTWSALRFRPAAPEAR
jgi:hypothetical protein